MPQNDSVSFDNNGSTQNSVAEATSLDISLNNTFSLEGNSPSTTTDIKDVLTQITSHIDNINTVNKLANDASTALPTLIKQFQDQYESLNTTKKALEEELDASKSTLNIQKDAILKALNNGEISNNPNNISTELHDLITAYINIKSKTDKIDSQINTLKQDLKQIKQFVDDFGLKTQQIPQVSSEYTDLAKSLNAALKRVEETTRVDLYKHISDALSNGNTDQLPQDLLNLIQHLIIDRLEDISKPYEELSKRYVEGEINHDQFTAQLRKGAFLTVLREKVIEDIIHEYENNNLSSPIIPNRLKMATEKMMRSTENKQDSSSKDLKKEDFNKPQESINQDESGAMSGAYFMD